MSTVSRFENFRRRSHVRRLCRILRRRSVLSRRRAAQALGALGDPDGIPCLEHALQTDNDEYVIRWTIKALQAIGTGEAVDVLTRAMFGDGRLVPQLAMQALVEMPDRQAATAIKIRDILLRNDWQALAAINQEAHRPLAVVMQSAQFDTWPSGKRKQVITISTQLGLKSTRHSKEMINMGIFVSEVHTIGDLLRGLRHHSPKVRMAAAEKLAISGRSWTTRPLYRRFKHEVKTGQPQNAAIVIARALIQLDDSRGIDYYKERLYHAEGPQAAEAARALAEIGVPDSVKTLFTFAASPPPPPAYRNVPLVLSVLESIGPPAVDALRSYVNHPEAKTRRLMIEIIDRCGHPNAADLLSEMAVDDNPEIQHAALDALANLNSEAAARKLAALANDVPERWVIRALASITHPEGPKYLRKLVPDMTSVSGVLREDDRSLVSGAFVQIIKQHHFEEGAGRWDWQAVSARACTGEEGRFNLVLLTGDETALLRIKIMLPSQRDGKEGETFTADLSLEFSHINQVKLQIDRFFNRLVITEQSAQPGTYPH